jgi:hypothetical protein
VLWDQGEVHPTIEITHPDTSTITNQNKEGKDESHSSLFGKKDSQDEKVPQATRKK